MSVTAGGKEGTPLRGDEEKLIVTSHQGPRIGRVSLKDGVAVRSRSGYSGGNDGQSALADVELLGIWSRQFHERVSLRLFDGGLFCRFWSFLPLLVNFDPFLTPIFPFFAFFAFLTTVYSIRGWHPDVLLIAKRF